MHRPAVRGALWALSLLMCFALAGCGGKALAEYKENLYTAMDTVQSDITGLAGRMSDFDGSEDSLPAIADAIEACREDCQAILEMAPPEKAAEGHALVASAMESYLDAMDLYSGAFASLEALRDESTPSQLETAQTLLSDGSEDLIAAAALLGALN